MTVPTVNVLLWGVGALGTSVARLLAGDRRFRIVGATDADPRIAGRPLSEVVGTQRGIDPMVLPSIESSIDSAAGPVDVILHMTESDPERVVGQLHVALMCGANVVTAAEWMYHPTLRYASLAESLDTKASEYGVSVTGAGINPGFVFDRLVLCAASANMGIRRVQMNRVVVVKGSGPGDREHAGYGLAPAAFEKGLAAGTIVGHMGFPEQIAVLAERLGVVIDQIDERWEPSTSARTVSTAGGELQAGSVTTIIQECIGSLAGDAKISARLAMYCDDQQIESFDELRLNGAYDVCLTLSPGCPSIVGAASVMINAIPLVMDAPPGLASFIDLPRGNVPRPQFRVSITSTRADRLSVTHVVSISEV